MDVATVPAIYAKISICLGGWSLRGQTEAIQWPRWEPSSARFRLDPLLRTGLAPRVALKGSAMDKWLCWSTMGVGGTVFFLFFLDFLFSMLDIDFKPFAGVSLTVDVVAMIACGVVFYLGWNAYQDVR
jgi:hypothetical protein